jgi:hypothetical protein
METIQKCLVQCEMIIYTEFYDDTPISNYEEFSPAGRSDVIVAVYSSSMQVLQRVPFEYELMMAAPAHSHKQTEKRCSIATPRGDSPTSRYATR